MATPDPDDGLFGEAGPLSHLPAAFRVLVPDLFTLPWRDESRSDCRRCVMAGDVASEISGEDAENPFVFHPEGRCCTYHPALANFFAGRALRQGGDAARVVVARIARGEGISPWGIRPSAAWLARYEAGAKERFGRDLSLRCPYWVGGDHACGLWRHRPATCRTWFCKHEHGLAGAVVWAQLKLVLARIESLLARLCVERGAPPSQDAEPAAWHAWFTWCADFIDRAHARELAAALDPPLAQASRDLITLRKRPVPAMPDVLLPAVGELWREPGQVRISGYSCYDTALAPLSIFAFLARLDGHTTWRQAQAHVRAAGGPDISDELIAELYRIGALEAPGARDATLLHREPWPGLAAVDAENR